MGSNEGSDGEGKQTVVVPEIKFTKLFINGEFVDAASGKTFETRDPRTGDVLADIAEADKADVDLAVAAAREAFEHGPWPRMSGYARGRAMSKLADLVEQHIEELAQLDGADAGKLLLLGKIIDIPHAVQMLRYYAGAADKIHGETLRVSGKYQGHTLKEPVGVVGVIIPWNFPSLMFFLKISPALAAGCTVVVKPAEQTPLSALFYANLAKEAGIPEGVINVVPGFGPTAGAAIASHMDIDSVAFTGSGEVGRLVMEASARSNLKTVSLELGGKCPLIIFDDADVDMAVELSRLAIFFNKGEVCVAGSRVYVQEGIYDEFVKKAVVAAQNWKVGDPFDVTTNMGPQPHISLTVFTMARKMVVAAVSIFLLAVFFCHGTEAKCQIDRSNLADPCDDIKCMDFCIQRKYQNGTCLYSGEGPGIIHCYCLNCGGKASVDQPALLLPQDPKRA